MEYLNKTILIKSVYGDINSPYIGKTGKVLSIENGQLHGTWGKLALIPEKDDLEIIE